MKWVGRPRISKAKSSSTLRDALVLQARILEIVVLQLFISALLFCFPVLAVMVGIRVMEWVASLLWLG